MNLVYYLCVLFTPGIVSVLTSNIQKPLSHYREVVTIIQKLLDLLTGLRKIRENIPRKETVSSVFHERREFVGHTLSG